MKLNPKTLSWAHPTAYTDGSPFGAADYAGSEFGYRLTGGDFVPTVSVPVSFAQTSLPIADLSLPQLVDFHLAMRTVARNGSPSEWAVYPEALRFDARIPLAPSAVAVN